LPNAKALRIHQGIARQLGIEILSGKFRPGDVIEGEIERSEALGVSRTAYREAIRILVAKGLLESRPKAGTHVTPRASWNLLDPQVLAWAFSGEPNANFIGDLFELRGIIEPAAAALAAARRTAEQLELMRAALDGMRRLTLASDAGQAADQDFHRVILQAAHNDALASLSGSVGAAVTWTTLFKQRHQPLPRDPLPEHEAVFSAITKGNPRRARTAMENLLRLALEDMGVIRK
jgi:DNA-binding FadR family transcriptional regulator